MTFINVTPTLRFVDSLNHTLPGHSWSGNLLSGGQRQRAPWHNGLQWCPGGRSNPTWTSSNMETLQFLAFRHLPFTHFGATFQRDRATSCFMLMSCYFQRIPWHDTSWTWSLPKSCNHCCWWPKILHQLSLVVFPIIYKVLYIPGGAGFLPSTVWNLFCFTIRVMSRQFSFPLSFASSMQGGDC